MTVEKLLEKMTTEEKAALLSGKTVFETTDIPRLSIPSVFCSDGPNGLRKQAGAADHLGLNPSLPATCFPTASSMANSWDEKLIEEVGAAIGEEALEQGVGILLGPGLNIKRNPLCGRNFEYFSEDPYLSGKLAAAYIRGVESKGVSACPKHYAVNSQELRRMAMNSVIDERTLREIYLSGFEIAVKEGKPRCIMSSYNEVNGVYANENIHLLTEILRDEWGFDGIVVTDWGGSNDHVAAVKNGSNLEMPACGYEDARKIIKALDEGRLSEEELDRCVKQVLNVIMPLGENLKKQRIYDREQHHQLAGKVARESIVLLKNEESRWNKGRSVLPLRTGCRVALIGEMAERPLYQGGGSSMVNNERLDTIKSLITDYGWEFVGYAPGYVRGEQTDMTGEKEALSLAARADAVIFCFGMDVSDVSEGVDRTRFSLPENQISLLRKLSEQSMNQDLIGVLYTGSSVEVPWEGCCQALLTGYLNGQAGAGALLDVLSGKEVPLGKLNETWAKKYEDTPSRNYYPGRERSSEYREGIYVGYRYFDTVDMEVQYPFGYGLTYTEFSYADLKVEEQYAEFTLKNTGKRDAAEIVQLYVHMPRGFTFHPKKELKGFQKIWLQAGEEKRVRISFDSYTFRCWDSQENRWDEESGEYEILIGASSEDIRLSGTIAREGLRGTENEHDGKVSAPQLPSYESGQISRVSDQEYEVLLGHAIPDGAWSGDLKINDAVCQMKYARNILARQICHMLENKAEQSVRKGKPDLNILFIYNIPFRGIAKMTGGIVSMEMVEGLVDMANGRMLRGLRKFTGGFFKNRRENKKFQKMLYGR